MREAHWSEVTHHPFCHTANVICSHADRDGSNPPQLYLWDVDSGMMTQRFPSKDWPGYVYSLGLGWVRVDGVTWVGLGWLGFGIGAPGVDVEHWTLGLA